MTDTDTADTADLTPLTYSRTELVGSLINGEIELDQKSIEALRAAPSVTERRAEVGLPEPVRTDDIAGHDLAFMAWQAQDAIVPDTGDITAGYLVVGYDFTMKRNFVLFIGGVALVREFGRLAAPVRGRIEKRGRTWVLR